MAPPHPSCCQMTSLHLDEGEACRHGQVGHAICHDVPTSLCRSTMASVVELALTAALLLQCCTHCLLQPSPQPPPPAIAPSTWASSIIGCSVRPNSRITVPLGLSMEQAPGGEQMTPCSPPLTAHPARRRLKGHSPYGLPRAARLGSSLLKICWKVTQATHARLGAYGLQHTLN